MRQYREGVAVTARHCAVAGFHVARFLCEPLTIQSDTAMLHWPSRSGWAPPVWRSPQWL